MTTVETARQPLLRHDERAQPYRFIQRALPYLEGAPEDDAVRLKAVAAYATLGLCGPAVALVQARPDMLSLRVELPAAVDALRKQPSGRVAWESLRSRFERNLAAAVERFETVREQEGSIRAALGGLELYRTRDGNWQLARPGKAGLHRWLPAFSDWKAELKAIDVLNGQHGRVCFPIQLEGVGFGELLWNAFDSSRRMFLTYTPCIFTLEPNLAQLAAWLHVEDHQELFASPRFRLFVGPNAADAYLAAQERESWRALPDANIRVAGWGDGERPVGAAAVDTLADREAAEHARMAEDVRRKLAGRSGFGWYAARFRRGRSEPLRVLGVTSRFTTVLQYAMRDVRQTLEARGHAFRLLIEPDDHTPMLRYSHYVRAVAEFMPDLILMIDHNRREFGQLFDFPIPFCNWIQDELTHLFEPAADRLGPYDLVMGYITQRSARNAGYDWRQCLYSSMPVNQRLYGAPADALEDERLAPLCDVSYVSNLSQSPDSFLAETLPRFAQPEVRRLLAHLYETLRPRIARGQAPCTRPQTVGLIQQVAAQSGLELSDASAESLRLRAVDRLINLFFRQQPLEWAAELGLDLHLYGRGWESHPRLARFARGVAENGAHSRAIFRRSRINLQLYPDSGVHQRLLEGLASGGFFLIRGTPADAVSPLYMSIAERCAARGIRGEDELWNTADPALAADVRRLNEATIAPKRLYDGFVGQLYDYRDWAHRLDMAHSLPSYGAVRFGTRAEFAAQVRRWLDDAAGRAAIVERQRAFVLEHHTYDALFERLFDFAADYFAGRASQERLTPAAALTPPP